MVRRAGGGTRRRREPSSKWCLLHSPVWAHYGCKRRRPSFELGSKHISVNEPICIFLTSVCICGATGGGRRRFSGRHGVFLFTAAAAAYFMCCPDTKKERKRNSLCGQKAQTACSGVRYLVASNKNVTRGEKKMLLLCRCKMKLREQRGRRRSSVSRPRVEDYERTADAGETS